MKIKFYIIYYYYVYVIFHDNSKEINVNRITIDKKCARFRFAVVFNFIVIKIFGFKQFDTDFIFFIFETIIYYQHNNNPF